MSDKISKLISSLHQAKNFEANVYPVIISKVQLAGKFNEKHWSSLNDPKSVGLFELAKTNFSKYTSILDLILIPGIKIS